MTRRRSRLKARPLGHVAIIDHNPRRGGTAEAEREAKARRKAGYKLAEDVRYNARSTAERVNGAAKDSFGARYVRVRGHDKVYCHLMFGILALSVTQIMRLIE